MISPVQVVSLFLFILFPTIAYNRKTKVMNWIFRLTGGPGGPWKPTGPPSPITPLEPTRPFLPDSPAGPRFPLLPCCPGTPASPAWKTNKYKHTHKQASALLHCVLYIFLNDISTARLERNTKWNSNSMLMWPSLGSLQSNCISAAAVTADRLNPSLLMLIRKLHGDKLKCEQLWQSYPAFRSFDSLCTLWKQCGVVRN